MKKLNVGFIGFGFIGKVHAYGYLNLPLFYNLDIKPKITHVCTGRPATAQKGAEQVDAKYAVTDFKEITENPDIDIVHICTPNNLHKDAVISAMKNNKNIYCDKPLTATLEEAKEIENALADYKGIAQMTLQNRFFPATIRAKQIIDDGFFGELLEFRASYLHSGSSNPDAPLKWKLSKKSGGGVIADLASHILDLMHHLLGEYSAVNALSHIAFSERPSVDDPSKKVKVEVEDCVKILAKMKRGGVGIIEASKIATGTEDEIRFEIHGSKGAIRFNGMDAHHLEIYDNTVSDKPFGGCKGWTKIDTGQRFNAPASGFPGPKFSIGWIRGHMACLANFLTCVQDGKKAEPGLEQGIYIQKLLEITRRSAEENKWLEV
jgi:predicted dehydrogenase